MIKKSRPFTLSLDRIDSSKGYTKDNCRFILLGINMLRGMGTDSEMYTIAEALLNNRGK